MEFTIRLAGVNIAVTSIYDEVCAFCRDYVCSGPPDLSVVITREDIDFERRLSLREYTADGEAPPRSGDAYLETLAVYRKIAAAMPDLGAFLMHGAVVAVGGRAWLFTAPSGTGKTTHIRLWLENIAGSYVVNGDKPLIRAADEITVYGTPWAGKEGMQQNVGVRLCGIVLLERGAVNSIRPIDYTAVLPTLIGQSYRPSEKSQLIKTLELIEAVGNSVPLWRMQCNMLPDAALTAFEVLNYRSDM